VVGASYLGARLDTLKRAQNPDGGWGYFPGKQSWLEPTFYAALALHGGAAADLAWTLLASWQQPDGSWRPSNDVQVSNWGTSLCVSMAAVRGEWGEPLRKGVTWLLGSAGVESNLVNRVAARVGLLKAERDLSLEGWPWKPDTSSWVEPTAHALVALKKASAKFTSKDLRERVRVGEAQILNVRCRDGGWNYGSPAALGVDLPSYPETTALALLGLQGRGDLANALDVASRMARETASPLARAWLTVALRLHGGEAPPTAESAPSPDVMMTAIEALAVPEGNYHLLKTGAAT
jgi:hypothetical protein